MLIISSQDNKLITSKRHFSITTKQHLWLNNRLDFAKNRVYKVPYLCYILLTLLVHELSPANSGNAVVGVLLTVLNSLTDFASGSEEVS